MQINERHRSSSFFISILVVVLFTLPSCSGLHWQSHALTQQEISVVKYRCLQGAQQKESNNTFTFQHRNLNERDKNIRTHQDADYDSTDSLAESFTEGLFGQSSRQQNYGSNMVLNNTLFEACMNAHGAFLGY